MNIVFKNVNIINLIIKCMCLLELGNFGIFKIIFS